MNKAEVFVKHIKNHLAEDDEVICTICDKSIGEIYEERRYDAKDMKEAIEKEKKRKKRENHERM